MVEFIRDPEDRSGAFRYTPRITKTVPVEVRKNEILRCADCREIVDERQEETRECKCGCETDFSARTLCTFHALSQRRCIICGRDMDAPQKTAAKQADRKRRKRELQTAVAEKDKVRDITTARRRRTRKECGKHPPARQRHRAFAR
jgi:hypothetical protein